MTHDSTPGWNIAEIWERHADRFPDALAQVQGDRSFTWSQFDRRADGVASTLLGGGAARQDKIAHYLYNCPEYLESMFGMFKAGLVPINTNYRYTDDEISYLWNNADVVGVVFHGVFASRCESVSKRLPNILTWIWVDDGTGDCPSWAVPYESAASSANSRTSGAWGRTPDDLYMLYTGGTTGMPKGVMWRQDDVVISLDAASKNKLEEVPGWEEFEQRFAKPGPRNLPAAPLMHGTGAFNAIWTLCIAGAVVTMRGRTFDPVEVLDTIERHRIGSASIAGDAFGKPIMRALDAEPDRWDISSLRIVMSSGVMFTAATKAALLRHNPRLILIDSLGSSEAIGMAHNTTTSDPASQNSDFTLGSHTKVLTDDGREVKPGSGELGRVAIRGRTPLGYYKDPEKSAGTFITFEGVRWSIPGDYAEVDADGGVRLLGRGSQCINTGGEKVYPEEVEEALKSHPTVADAAVLGLPDDRFGQAITALVEPANGMGVDSAELIRHVKLHLAGYKAPKRILQVETIGRSANGKLDYTRLTAEAAALVVDADSNRPVAQKP